MTTPSRTPLSAALAACLSIVALASACNSDEPATHVPDSGEWSYAQTSVVSNTCAPDFVGESFTTFWIDYDDGDSFDIELDAEDVTCEIDGTQFYCGDLVITNVSNDADITITWTRTWEGELLSPRAIEGNQITRVSCAGEDCNFLGDAVPCTDDVTFDAMAI